MNRLAPSYVLCRGPVDVHKVGDVDPVLPRWLGGKPAQPGAAGRGHLRACLVGLSRDAFAAADALLLYTHGLVERRGVLTAT